MSTSKYLHPPSLPRAVSIGWTREDGDFEVICTLKCPLLCNDRAFEAMVDAVTGALEAISGLGMEVLARDDTAAIIVDGRELAPNHTIYTYLHPVGAPQTLSFTCIDSPHLDDGEYSLVGTLYGEDLLFPDEFDFVANVIRTFLGYCLTLSIQVWVRQDAPSIVELEP